jgi:hypothetical protein
VKVRPIVLLRFFSSSMIVSKRRKCRPSSCRAISAGTMESHWQLFLTWSAARHVARADNGRS